MKPSLTHSHKNPELNSTPSLKQERIYPHKTNIIQLAEHRLKKRPVRQQFFKNTYFINRNKTKPLTKRGVVNRFQQLCSQDSFIKWVIACLAIGFLITVFFFIGQSVIK